MKILFRNARVLQRDGGGRWSALEDAYLGVNGKYIEFIGDSITCGYGIDTACEANTFSTTNENVNKAFSYLTAAALGADASFVSYSGHGLISGYTGNPDIPTLDELIRKMPERTRRVWP